LYLSSDKGKNWKNINYPGSKCTDVLKNNKFVFATSDYIYPHAEDYNLYRNELNTNNWEKIKGFTSKYFENIYSSLASYNNRIFLSTYGGLYSSTNNGTSWESNNDMQYCWNIIVDKNEIFAISGLQIYKADLNDNKLNWVILNSLPIGTIQLIIKDQFMIARADTCIYLSKDRGITWNDISYNKINNYYSIELINDMILCGTDSGNIIISTDLGKSIK
jgi:hypothetical protein